LLVAETDNIRFHQGGHYNIRVEMMSGEVRQVRHVDDSARTWRSKLMLGAAALAVVTTGDAGQTAAQEAAAMELPEVVVTAPSPVVKPKKKSTKPTPQTVAAQEAEPAPASAASTEAANEASGFAPAIDAASLPGTLVIDDQTFATVTVVGEREVLANQGETITDSLQNKPGIAGSTFAPGSNRPIIRGLDNFRVRIQENGIGSGDVSALSEDHAVTIDPFAAERMEVIRGPATLRYGSQAIGGVVAVENERIPTAIPRGGFSGEIRGGLTSVDEGRDGAIKATAGAGNFAIHADAFARGTEDYEAPLGVEPNTFVDSNGFSVGTSLVGTDGFLGVAFVRLDSLYGIPGEEALEKTPRIDLEQDKVLVRGERRVQEFGIEALRFWFGASDYAHNEVVVSEDEGGDIIGTRFTNEESEARAELQHQTVRTALGDLSGAIGLQWSDLDVKGVAVDEPIDALLDPANVKTIAGFWFEELQATRDLRFQAAARIEQTEAKGTGYESIADLDDPTIFQGTRSFTPVSASLGALYDLPMGVVARLNGQYTERAPAAAEIFSKGVHEATGTFEIGNPDLGIETARTIELGFRRAAGALRFDAAAYVTQFDGFIYKNLIGEDFCEETLASCTGGGDLDLVLYEQRDARFYGVEIAAQHDVAPIWDGLWGVDGQYDFVNAEFSDGENVPRMPPHRLGGGVYYRDQAWYARAGVLHAFEQDRVAPIEPATPGYTLVSAELSYTAPSTAPFRDLAQEVTIGLRGENLADDKVLNSASFKRLEDVLLPGASVRLFGSIKLN
jgi:iron complex outermembrane receptor protein